MINTNKGRFVYEKVYLRGWGGIYDKQAWDDYWQWRKKENGEEFSHFGSAKAIIENDKVIVPPFYNQKIVFEIRDKAIIFVLKNESYGISTKMPILDIGNDCIISGGSAGIFVDSRVNGGKEITWENFKRLIKKFN